MATTTDAHLSKSNSHALVIGSGIAGLLAARILADYFDQVTIVERDRFSEQPAPRQGVPQSYFIHVLLTQGQRILEQLFPRLTNELEHKGAPAIDWTTDCSLLLLDSWAPRFPSDLVSRACTRNLLETVIRQRLVKYSPVEFLEATQVTGLLANLGNTTVTGVKIQDSNGIVVELAAQLVLDASGRSSKAPQWLKSLGYEMPLETAVNSFLGYACRRYQSLGDSFLDSKALYVMPKAPEHPRGSVIYQVEEGQWMVSLIGVGRDYPPTDEAGFLDFARNLRSSKIYEAIKDGQPLSPIYGYRRTENRWRKYEHLNKSPENFIVLGDAVCAFNPVYGQGMTVAALGALTLNKCLKHQYERHSNRELIGFARYFQKQLAKVNTVPWLMATGDDFRWSTTQGQQPDFMTQLMHWYLDQVMKVASERAEVYKVFIEVIHLLKPPTAFFQPAILMQVLKVAMNRRSKVLREK